MNVIIFLLFVCVIFVLLFYLVNFLFSVKLFYKNKVSPFECGFLSIGLVQNSFSIHFFLVMLMFVVFDLEIVMFFGVLLSDLDSLLSFLLLMIFMMSSLYMEWYYGKLVWMV